MGLWNLSNLSMTGYKGFSISFTLGRADLFDCIYRLGGGRLSFVGVSLEEVLEIL